MSIFKKNDNNMNNIIRTRVVVNGKVVSDNDPEVKIMMGNMQKKFGAIFGEGNVINAGSDSEDIAEFVESTLRLAGISDAAEETELKSSSALADDQPKVLECKNCGAWNRVIPGTNAVCEYCESGLE